MNIGPAIILRFYEVRPRKDHRGIDLIPDVLPFGRVWYDGPKAVANAIGYAEHDSRSHDAVICVYDDAGNLIEVHSTPLAVSPPQRLWPPYRELLDV